MPLLRRQPFVPNLPPPDLQPNDEVFYCPLTKEVFKDFEAFFERTILCNSLLWSCSLTGKSNLTFQEAVDSEKRALQTVNDIPFELKQPLLYIASLTCRGKVTDACDDVYYFMKDRYFVNENLEAIIRGKWHPVKIMKVVPPTLTELESYKEEHDDELSKEDKLLMLSQYGPPPELLKYEVKEIMNIEHNMSATHTVTVDCVRREKRLYSRDKVRVYLRHCMEFDEFQGIWVIKPEAWKALKMESITYAGIFITGVQPTFEVSRAVKKSTRTSLSLSKASDTPKTPTRTNANGTPVKGMQKRTSQTLSNTKSAAKSPKLDAEALAKEFIKIREERESLRQFADRRKQQKIEEKQQAKEKKREEKRAMAEYVKEWSKQRDDLECDDLKDLPTPTPVQCRIPNGLFGDFLMILEFFYCFGDELQLKDAFPAGLSFELLERAIIENEVSGPLSDIVQVLLRSIFEFQDAEAEEVKEAQNGDQHDSEVAESGPTYQGTPLKKLSMDSLTVSEILRLHLVAAGGRSSELRSKWRYQQRGGYSSADDPGVQLRDEDPHILHMLATNTVYELAIGDKIKVLKCLCHQILTYVSIRDVLEEKYARLLQVRQEMRALHTNERRMRREDAARKAKLRLMDENPTVEGVEDHTGPGAAAAASEIDEIEKESAKRKAEFIKKEQLLRQQSIRLQAMTHLTPLGLDRAFRRFWVFESCPGLFVEHDDDFVGLCMTQPTPLPSCQANLDQTKGKEDIRKFFKASNKENESTVAEISSEKVKVFGICTANPSDCPVHATYIPRTKWAFYDRVESIDELLLSLNERGFRESALKTVILHDKDRISENIQKCCIHRLDLTKPETQQPSETRKSTRQIRKEKEYDANLHFLPGTPVEHILERTFMDMILETEEKIFVGGLGTLKVKDRNSWRQAIEDGKYDPLVDTIIWGGKVETKPRMKPESHDVDEEDSGSVISSSIDGEPLPSVTAKKNVCDMATALLQLAQSVESKYLKKPLGEDEKEKKKRLKAEEALKKWEDSKETSDTAKIEPKTVRTPLEKWELSLHACTSFSQLYVHLALLDNSITWNRSALNARCRICRRKGDAEKMLLCDGCDKGHHMYCLRPPLAVIPDGDWFCYECKPREKPRTPRKTRRVFSELSDDEEEENQETQDVADEEAEVEAEEGESDDESVHNETCAVCQEGGNVLCCDTCPAVYHLDCVSPPMRKVPRGKWSCPQCKIPPQEKERIKLREKNVDGRSSSSRPTRGRQILDFDTHDKEDVKHPVTRQRTHTDPIKTRSPEVVQGKRRSATEAVDKIAQATKRLKGDSYDDDSSGFDDGRKWTGSQRNRRHRPIPLTSSSVEGGFVDNTDLENLIIDLMKHSDSWPFRKPVTKAEAPDYHRVIKQAMDLGTIKYKLGTIKYHNAEEFLEDLKLIFTNCYTYNHESADEYKCGQRLSKYLDERLKKLGFFRLIGTCK